MSNESRHTVGLHFFLPLIFVSQILVQTSMTPRVPSGLSHELQLEPQSLHSLCECHRDSKSKRFAFAILFPAKTHDAVSCKILEKDNLFGPWHEVRLPSVKQPLPLRPVDRLPGVEGQQAPLGEPEGDHAMTTRRSHQTVLLQPKPHLPKPANCPVTNNDEQLIEVIGRQPLSRKIRLRIGRMHNFSNGFIFVAIFAPATVQTIHNLCKPRLIITFIGNVVTLFGQWSMKQRFQWITPLMNCVQTFSLVRWNFLVWNFERF